MMLIDQQCDAPEYGIPHKQNLKNFIVKQIIKKLWPYF